MPQHPDHISMALFCDFENVALGVRDAQYDKFDIKRVLERLLLKGSIVVKKAYCDWERYRNFKGTMHEANFELIEIPHVRQSGKNSADIRLVVDALDLCYTKSHVNTFVIISGDSDFSPLVSKLRENAKHVIGVGVKNSTSDLLIANCDEFIFYDDLVRESQRQAAKRDQRENNPPQQRRSPEEERRRREEMDARRTKIVELAAETYEALVTDRDDGGRIWASVLKEALKRRNPGFSESYFGFRTFGNLLEEAQSRGLLSFGRDEKSGAYVYRGTGQPAEPVVAQASTATQAAGWSPSHADESFENGEDTQTHTQAQPPEAAAEHGAAREPRQERGERTERGDRSERGGRNERGNRGGRGGRGDRGGNAPQGARQDGARARPGTEPASPHSESAAAPGTPYPQEQAPAPAPRRERRPFVEPAVHPRDDDRRGVAAAPPAQSPAPSPAPAAIEAPADATASQAAPKPARKTSSRGARKPAATKNAGEAAAAPSATAAPAASDQPAAKAPARKTARKPAAKKAARTAEGSGNA